MAKRHIDRRGATVADAIREPHRIRLGMSEPGAELDAVQVVGEEGRQPEARAHLAEHKWAASNRSDHSVVKASSWRHQGVVMASSRRHQGVVKASSRLHQGVIRASSKRRWHDETCGLTLRIAKGGVGSAR